MKLFNNYRMEGEPALRKLRPGFYLFTREITTIEDPRQIDFKPAERMNPETWETHKIAPLNLIRIKGRFELRGKIWYEAKIRNSTKPQVISYRNLIGCAFRKTNLIERIIRRWRKVSE